MKKVLFSILFLCSIHSMAQRIGVGDQKNWFSADSNFLLRNKPIRFLSTDSSFADKGDSTISTSKATFDFVTNHNYNLSNTDLVQTGDRYYNGHKHSLTIDSLQSLTIIGRDADNSGDGGIQIYTANFDNTIFNQVNTDIDGAGFYSSNSNTGTIAQVSTDPVGSVTLKSNVNLIRIDGVDSLYDTTNTKPLGIGSDNVIRKLNNWNTGSTNLATSDLVQSPEARTYDGNKQDLTFTNVSNLILEAKESNPSYSANAILRSRDSTNNLSSQVALAKDFATLSASDTRGTSSTAQFTANPDSSNGSSFVALTVGKGSLTNNLFLTQDTSTAASPYNFVTVINDTIRRVSLASISGQKLYSGYGIKKLSDSTTLIADTTSSNGLLSKTRLTNSNYFVRSGDTASYVTLPNESSLPSVPTTGISIGVSGNKFGFVNSLNKTFQISTALIAGAGNVVDTVPNTSYKTLGRYNTDTIWNKLIDGNFGNTLKNVITLTTTGTGASTYTGSTNTLNIPTPINGGAGDSAFFWNLRTGNNINGGNAFLGTNTAHPLIFKTNNVEAARFDSTKQYLGIGTAAPASRLTVNESGAAEALNVSSTFTTLSTSSFIAEYKNNSVLRSDLTSMGTQSWFLNSGSGEVGEIRYATPGSLPGILLLNTSGTARSQIRQFDNSAGGLSFGSTSGSSDPGNQIIMTSTSQMSIGAGSPTSVLSLKSGTSTAGSAPIKLATVAPSLLTTPEKYAVEVDSGSTGGNAYYTNAGGTRYFLIKGLTATATLDFPSTLPSSASTLTVTVTGASVGDPVDVGAGNTQLANSNYTAQVTSTNTVTVSFNNIDAINPQNPASGAFRVAVEHF